MGNTKVTYEENPDAYKKLLVMIEENVKINHKLFIEELTSKASSYSDQELPFLLHGRGYQDPLGEIIASIRAGNPAPNFEVTFTSKEEEEEENF